MKDNYNYKIIKLGNSFNELIIDIIHKKIKNLEYFEALDLLTNTLEIDKNLALGILFNDYKIRNTDTDIIIENAKINDTEFDLLEPLEQFIYDFYNEYDDILYKCYRLLSSSFVFIDIYNTDDYHLPIIRKYFPIYFNSALITENFNGGFYVQASKFFYKLYQSYIDNTFYKLSTALYKSFDIKTLTNSLDIYIEAINITVKYDKLESCIKFLDIYYPFRIDSSILLDKLSKIREAFKTYYKKSILFGVEDIPSNPYSWNG